MKQNCSLRYIKMKTNKRYDDSKASLVDSSLIDSDTIINRRFENITFDEDIVAVSFDNCQFINCTFNCKIKNTTFFNVKFSKCELSNIIIINTGIHFCLFEDSRMVGITFIDDKFKTCDIKSCQMKLTQFSSVVFNDINFVEVNLTDLNISECNFEEKILFDNCDMQMLEVRDTLLFNVDVSSSNIDGINCDIRLVKGMIVSEVQAIELINLIGVQIK